MMKRLIITMLVVALFCPQAAHAGKKGSAEADFTQRYTEAAAQGPEALKKFSSDIMNNGTAAEAEMLGNMQQGMTADGKPRPKGEDGKPAGFMGDPNDPGPQDWSDWNIKTDGKGNVIGFEEKDFEEKDKNGDGEIDKKEREEWNEKKKKEHEEAGGAPGEVPPVAEWDKDGDGKPDKGWDRLCWQCCEGKEEEKKNECHDGRPGNCDNGGSCEISEECIPANETHDGKEYECHQCEYKTDQVDWCADRGYFSSANCNGQCHQGPCIPVDIDIQDGTIVPANRTRERGSTRKCYTCMRVTSVEITYIAVIIETPFGIYVLGDDVKEKLGQMAGFDVSSVMGLAQSNGSPMSRIKGLMGSMGLDALSMLGNPMDINSLGNLLKQGMTDNKNRYGADCFDDFQQPNFAGAQRAPTSSSEEDIKEAQKNTKKGIEGGPRTEGPQEFGVDPAQEVAVDGPIIACGKSDGEKALMVLDSAGNPVEKILPSTLEGNPNAINDAIMKAQAMSQQVQGLVQGGPEGLINTLRQKAVAMVTKKVQDVVFGKKGDPKTEFIPNDQFYKAAEEKKGKLFGILGGSNTPAPKLGLGGIQIGEKTPTRSSQKPEFKDQWGIQRIGYLPYDDEGSAWKAADGEAKNVIVAVVDSGIDFDHPDLPQYIWTNPGEVADNGIDDDGNGLVDDVHGWNFLDDNNDLTDLRGHGTAVAGIIAAKRNNSIGIAGINPGAIIMPVKVADEEGETDSVKVYQGINYAVDHGAQVVNVSLGGRGASKMLESALRRAREMGVFVAVASGNTGEYVGDVSPASAMNAFTVSAIDYDGEWSTISSVGPNVALLAPGEEILSLRSKDSFHPRAVKDPVARLYFRQSGTSFSTPMVSATASLLLTLDPTLTPERIEDILLNTATDMDVAGWDGQHGAGTLDAAAALKAVKRKDFLTVKLDRFVINRDDKKKLESVDVYATVRGNFKEFTVGAGKGKRASRFERMAGPFTKEAGNAWVARITKDNLRGSDEWVINITATTPDGTIRSAQALLEL